MREDAKKTINLNDKSITTNTPPTFKEPHYYESLLVKNPADPSTLYFLAQKYKVGSQHFKDIDDATYKEKLELSLHYFQLSLNNGCKKAKKEIKQIEKELYLNTASSFVLMKKAIIKYIGFSIIFIVLLFLIPNKTNDFTRDNTNNEPATDDPKKHHTYHFHFTESTPFKEIRNEMLKKTEDLKKLHPDSSFELTAIQTKAKNEKEVLTIFSFPTQEKPMIIKKNRDLTIAHDEDGLSLTILRSALYHYVIETGKFPATLSKLTDNFPNNYISSIPFDTISFKNHVSSSFDHSGGWLYVPPHNVSVENRSISDIRKMIEISLKPNFKHTCNNHCDFTPLEIHIDKKTHQLEVLMYGIPLKVFKVGLGKNNLTPEGQFKITKRVAFPNFHIPSSTRPFGTRGLELSDPKYAIHGTYEETSIGANVSNGCIRLTNTDIEALFSMVPLHTTVWISGDDSLIEDNNLSSELKLSNHSSSNRTVESIDHSRSTSGMDNGDSSGNGDNGFMKERDLNTIYHWAM